MAKQRLVDVVSWTYNATDKMINVRVYLECGDFSIVTVQTFDGGDLEKPDIGLADFMRENCKKVDCPLCDKPSPKLDLELTSEEWQAAMDKRYRRPQFKVVKNG